MKRSNASCPWPARTGRGAPAQVPLLPPPGIRGGVGHLARALAQGIQMRVGPVGIVNGTFGNRPTASPRLVPPGLQGQRQGQPVRHPPPRRPGPPGGDPGQLHGGPNRNRPGRPGYRRDLFREGDHIERMQRARVVAVAGYSIETPRLLLNSTSARFPNGLANNDDQVGRYVMVQAPPRAPGGSRPNCACTKPRPQRSLPRTSTKPTRPAVSPGGSPSKRSPPSPSDGPSTSSPRDTGAGPCANTCATTTTGPPSAYSTNSSPTQTTGSPWQRRAGPLRPARGPLRPHPRRQRQSQHGLLQPSHQETSCRPPAPKTSSASNVSPTSSAEPEWAPRPCNSVVDANQRTWAVPNLFISDGSVCPTQGSANPALTIMALASRLAQRMITGTATSPTDR